MKRFRAFESQSSELLVLCDTTGARNSARHRGSGQGEPDGAAAVRRHDASLHGAQQSGDKDRDGLLQHHTGRKGKIRQPSCCKRDVLMSFCCDEQIFFGDLNWFVCLFVLTGFDW